MVRAMLQCLILKKEKECGGMQIILRQKKVAKRIRLKKGLLSMMCSVIVLYGLLISRASAMTVWAQEENKPHLIQSTTLQEEWEAVTALDILQVLPVENSGEAEGLLQAQEANLASSVRIDNEQYRGSGVIFEITQEYIILMSNKHLLEYGDKTEVTFIGDRQVPAEAVCVSERYDMGIVAVACESLEQEERMQLRRVCWDSECSAQAESGDELFIIGSKEGPGTNVYVGTIKDPWWYSEDFATYMLYNDCNAEHGISGGGTFDSHGHYLGMLSAGNGLETLSLPLLPILEEYPVLLEKLSMELSKR